MNSYQEISLWLNRFLSSRGHHLPTGKPLFTYRMTENEFFQLQTLLSKTRSLKYYQDLGWAAAFCLYCSEWYRREYHNGWTWNGIEQSLNFEVDSNFRSQLIQLGFHYWKREIAQYNKNHHSYLGSVYREGGLPYALLISEDSRFQELFRSILAYYSQNPQVILDPLILLPYLTYFPEALKSETTLSLIVEMVTKISYLVEKYDLSHQTAPASFLDQNVPNWRIDFPIPLNNTADKLLLNLLDSAVKESRRKTKQSERYIITQTLVDIKEFKFKTELKLSKSFSFQSNNYLTKDRCILSLYEGNRKLTEISSAYLISDDTDPNKTITLRQEYAQTYRKEINLPLFLVLEQKGTVIYKELISESEIDVEAMPLVLSEDTIPRVIGSGSIQKKANTLHIVVAEKAKIQLKNEHSELIEDSSNNGLTHYLLSGEVIVHYDEEKFYISSKNEHIKKQFRLVGATLPYFTPNGRPIYLGLPKISQLNDEYCLKIGKTDQANSIYGDQYVHVLDKSGNLIFKQKVAILPSDFKIKFVKSSNPQEGIIEFYSSENFIVYGPKKSTGIDSKIIKKLKGIGKSLEIRCIDKPRTSLSLGIGVNLQSYVDMILPFPSSGVQILDNNNKVISSYKTLSLQELLGSRIRIYPDIETSANYSIDIENSQKNNYCFQYIVQDSPLEISLNEFRPEIISLFSISKHLDEQVKVIISQNNRIIRQINLTLYASDISVYGDTIEIEDMDNKIKLSLLSLTTLETCKLDKDEHGHYLLPNEINNPCLIISDKESILQSRTRFIPATKATEIKGELQQAIALPPNLYSNAVQLVLTQMAKDFNHSGWDYLNKLYQDFSYLPLSTFFIWKELIKNSQALVTFILKQSQIEKVMQHLQNEFNVIWAFIPIQVWETQLEIFKHSLGSIPDILINTITNNKLEQIKLFSPAFYNEGKTMPKAIMEPVLATWYQNLHNQNLAQYWISDFSIELSNWAKSQNIEISIQYKEYQQAVIFFPFFAAAVTCGQAKFDSLRPMEDKDFHTFKKLMEFDSDWFKPVYLYALQLFKNKDK
ncbi:STY4851/ECs_5259 family protein [Actinobacillus equuli]|uniref:STY4851/ECs_5259 family protein n=1 Tax=Actinobacillus equuli TaxID=718 RepID=UPI0024410D46|nr:STY4851/ECs_5259 family protein [Actinobacillus equuli]WGE64650.1 STY4851/ECs_5259 family protein [Actinobacillus equuli subsp. equuli]WGE72068.1 STY4851/ECs_5259 family protein [Actinobacillus equuli subsp. haemolyticus]WGE78611.1 STY4851/ECs_5259 family protein [Actinobacillus equuli subsp. equuli]